MKEESIEKITLASALGEQKCWINWRFEEKIDEKNGKVTIDKVPKKSNGQGNAKPNDTSTWSTFAEVDAARSRFNGVGVMFDGKILGVDLDYCIENGEVSKEIALFIEKAHTYTEISPSKTGIHVYLPLTAPMTLIRNKSPRGIGSDYECYVTGRWFTYSANPWKESYPVRTVTPEEALSLLEILGYPWKKDLPIRKEKKDIPVKQVMLPDEILLEKMFAAKNGEKVKSIYNGDVSLYGNDESSADLALCSHLAFWTARDPNQMERIWLASPLGNREKTQNRKDYRNRVIDKAIEGCEEVYSQTNKRIREIDTEIDNEEEDLLDTEEKQAQKMLLMKLVTSNPNIELFRDNYGNGHAQVVVDSHKEIMICRGIRFKQWLSHNYMEQYGGIADPSTLNTAIHAIESMSAFKGKEYKLHNRVAKVGDVIWLDLADSRNRSVKITATGWEIVDESPILFRRHAHQKEQVEPEHGGDINKLFDFVNVTEPTQQLLLLVYLVSCFIPDFPHVLLYIHGSQGSAKSTLSRILRRLVDPSKTEVLHMPKDERELKLQLSRHHLVFYENVDGISNAISTILCIGVTGGSTSERLYFTNGEDFIFDFQLNIGINGINISAVKADLLERSLLFELKPLDESNRRDEEEIFEGFEPERPKILGAILDVVSKALSIRPSIKLVKKPRMADFAIWGVAISKALGYSEQQFLEAYNAKINEQSEEALVESVEAAALLTFMQDKNFWEGTARELLKELNCFETEVSNDNQQKKINSQQLPKQPQVLMRRLNELKPNLKKMGIEFISRKEMGIKNITIKKDTGNINQIVNIDPSINSVDHKDDVGGIIPHTNASSNFDDFVDLLRSNDEKDEDGIGIENSLQNLPEQLPKQEGLVF